VSPADLSRACQADFQTAHFAVQARSSTASTLHWSTPIDETCVCSAPCYYRCSHRCCARQIGARLIWALWGLVMTGEDAIASHADP
jgi:hypothetical protein